MYIVYKISRKIVYIKISVNIYNKISLNAKLVQLYLVFRNILKTNFATTLSAEEHPGRPVRVAGAWLSQGDQELPPLYPLQVSLHSVYVYYALTKVAPTSVLISFKNDGFGGCHIWFGRLIALTVLGPYLVRSQPRYPPPPPPPNKGKLYWLLL